MADTMTKSPALDQIVAPILPWIREVDRRVDAVVASKEPLMSDLVAHVRRFRGKRLRPALVLMAARCAGDRVPSEAVMDLALITELVHTATLIHDDVIDRADTRRNSPSFNLRWDNQVAVIFGDYLFSKAFLMTVRIADLPARERLAEVTGDLCEGEMLQLESRIKRGMSEEEYMEMILRKTATFLGCCTAMGARLAGLETRHVETLDRVGERLGCAFQIVDDCLDLMGSEGTMGKSLGTDIATGKFTLPLIKFVETLGPAEVETLESLMGAGKGDEAKAFVHSRLPESGAVEAAWAEARRFTEAALRDLESLPESPGRNELIQISNYLISRSH
ncbi:MAG: polyprenyl synthetase family protein [Planctomycetota bacterium]